MTPSHKVALPLSLCALLVGAGSAGLFVGQKTAAKAEWLLTRAQAESETYVATLEGEHVDRQFELFDERAAVMTSAHTLRQAATTAFLFAFVSLFAAWLFFLKKRIDEQLIDVSGSAPIVAELATARAREGALAAR